MSTTTAAAVDMATRPEEVFGELTGTLDEKLAAARRTYRRLALEVHPDRNPSPSAASAFQNLTRIWELTQIELRAGTYGQPRGVTAAYGIQIRSKTAEYTLLERVAAGDIADVYRAVMKATVSPDPVEVAVKIVRAGRDNDLMQAEARNLAKIQGERPRDYDPFFPELIDSFIIRQPGAQRRANVFDLLEGFHTIEEILAAFPRGLDPRDMAWMFRRLLVALSLAHESEVVHGAPLPGNVLIHPEKHGLVLVGWGASVQTEGQIRSVVRRNRYWYPQEVINKRPVGPETDVSLAARTMIRLLDGHPETGVLPLSVPAPLRAFFRACVLPDREKRPDDAWRLKEDLDMVLRRLYGKPKFRQLYLPEKGAM